MWVEWYVEVVVRGSIEVLLVVYGCSGEGGDVGGEVCRRCGVWV